MKPHNETLKVSIIHKTIFSTAILQFMELKNVPRSSSAKQIASHFTRALNQLNSTYKRTLHLLFAKEWRPLLFILFNVNTHLIEL